ncbi:hypothetical protein [Hymenobacter bucti]|uniref:Uncharacterized protein n=1 Tax=Hymenobacter bucti TaxID=1844114 RepID=A0ABW4QWJ1_9BACT
MKYILALLLLLSRLALAQSTPNASIANSISAKSTQAVSVTAPVMSEKDYYKMMYEQALASSTAANTLTQWTLASVAGIIVLVIGGQIFFNYRLGERETDAIRSDMQAQIAEVQTALLRRMSELGASNIATLETRAEAIEKQLQISIERNALTHQAEILKQEGLWRKEVKDITVRLSDYWREFKLIEAKEELAKGEAPFALRMFLVLAKRQVKEPDGGIGFLLKGLPFLRAVSNLTAKDLGQINEILSVLKDKNEQVYTLWNDIVQKIPLV